MTTDSIGDALRRHFHGADGYAFTGHAKNPRKCVNCHEATEAVEALFAAEPLHELGVAEGRRQALTEEEANAESCAQSLDTLDGQEQLAEFYRLQAERFRSRLAAMGVATGIAAGLRGTR